MATSRATDKAFLTMETGLCKKTICLGTSEDPFHLVAYFKDPMKQPREELAVASMAAMPALQEASAAPSPDSQFMPLKPAHAPSLSSSSSSSSSSASSLEALVAKETTAPRRRPASGTSGRPSVPRWPP